MFISVCSGSDEKFCRRPFMSEDEIGGQSHELFGAVSKTGIPEHSGDETWYPPRSQPEIHLSE